MRRARSRRRVQAQRKFAQGAYVPPNAVAVVAPENRRDAVQGNVTINNVTATGLLDVVSLQSAASTTEREGLHSHLTSQPVVLIERLRGRTLPRDEPPPLPQTETSPPQHPKSTIKNTAEPPTLRAVRKKQELKRVHPMSLRSRRLSKLEMNKLLALSCVPLRKNSLKRKKASSDEDEPLIFHKTRKKRRTAAASESSPWEKSLSSKDINVRQEITEKEIQTNPVSSKHTKDNSAKKKTSAPRKSVTVVAIKEHLESAHEKLDNLVTQNDTIVPVYPVVAPVNLIEVPDALVVIPDASVLVPDAPALVRKTPVLVPDPPVLVPDAQVLVPDAQVLVPDAQVLVEDAVVTAATRPLQMSTGRDTLVVGSSNRVIVPVPFVPYEADTPEQNAEYLERLDNAMPLLDELDLSNEVNNDDESTGWEKHVQVYVHVAPDQTVMVDSQNQPSSSLYYEGSSDSDDDGEQIMRFQAPINVPVHRSTNDSPQPGPSGMQSQLRKNNLNTDQRITGEVQPVITKTEAPQNELEMGNEQQTVDGEKQDDYAHLPEVSRELQLQQNKNEVGRGMCNFSSSDSNEVSSDGDIDHETTHRLRKKINYQKGVALRNRALQYRTRRTESQQNDDPLLLAQKQSQVISRLTNRLHEIRTEKRKLLTRFEVDVRHRVIAEMEAKHRMELEVDQLSKTLDKEKDAKKMNECPDLDEPGTSESPTEDDTLVDAPVYFPTAEDFKDPISFYEEIYPIAMKYGVCKVVPPDDWMPTSQFDSKIKFDTSDQFIERLFNRWGPAAREISAIKLCLQQHRNLNYLRPARVDGVEIDLSKLYHIVQRLGGLGTVMQKNRWGKVADDLKIPKTAHFEAKLENIYLKYLIAYETLTHQERQATIRKVELLWSKKNQKLLERAMNPPQRLLGLESSDDETEDEETKAALNMAEDCIVKGQVMALCRFKKLASLTYENMFGPGSEAAAPPPLKHIEELYWRLVTTGSEHVCVHTAAIDTGEEGHGFTTKTEPYASHPWNPKQVINNHRNVLRYLGPVVGVTLPTLILGMLFSTSCWHKDPHGVAWYEYQSKGPARIWYGIPADQEDNFRKAVETLSPTSCQNKGLWLPSEVTMIPPSVLRQHNVRLTRVTQNEGEIIMTFPNAYTSWISTGYTESESVYFASPEFLDSMSTAFKVTKLSYEPTMFSIQHLLYNIGRDTEADQNVLKLALPLFEKMMREEVTNRQILQERGLPIVQELVTTTTGVRPLDECDSCRVSLFLSKVTGLPARQSVLCLVDTLKLLESIPFKDTGVIMRVHVTVLELNRVFDDMRRRHPQSQPPHVAQLTDPS